ncbi:MAG: lipoyl(octanoyl) transferase LipB [bacterium]
MQNNKDNLTKECQKKGWFCIELPLTDYREAWDIQTLLVSARKKRVIDRDVVLLLEHPPIFTLGRRGGINNLTVSKSFLNKQEIPLIQVERGGNITYHGPGQLVMYPIIDLHMAGVRVADYIKNLEEVMIRCCADFGIKADRNPINRGVWVKQNKIGSVGIAIRRGITFHGISLNVNLRMMPFSWINPCGLQNISMTSMAQELSDHVSLDRVRSRMKHHTERVFGIGLEVVKINPPKGLSMESCFEYLDCDLDKIGLS